MADNLLKKKVRDALRTTYFNAPDDLVDVSDGDGDNVHVVVVSRKFDKESNVKEDLIWSVLTDKLEPEEWGKVSLWTGVSPEVIKAI